MEFPGALTSVRNCAHTVGNGFSVRWEQNLKPLGTEGAARATARRKKRKGCNGELHPFLCMVKSFKPLLLFR